MSTDKAMVTDKQVRAYKKAYTNHLNALLTSRAPDATGDISFEATRVGLLAALAQAEQPVAPLGKGWNETDGYDRVYIQFAKWRQTGQTQVHRSSLFPFDGGQEYVRASHRSDQLPGLDEAVYGFRLVSGEPNKIGTVHILTPATVKPVAWLTNGDGFEEIVTPAHFSGGFEMASKVALENGWTALVPRTAAGAFPALSSMPLTKHEIDFCLCVLSSPGSKLNDDNIADHWEDGEFRSHWKRPEELGLVETVGSYKWKPTQKLLDTLRAALAHPPAKREAGEAAAPVQDVQGWLPMETAPKDGKHCILSIPTGGGCIYSIQGAFINGKWMNAANIDAEPLAWMPNVLLPADLCPWTDAYKARLATTEGQP